MSAASNRAGNQSRPLAKSGYFIDDDDAGRMAGAPGPETPCDAAVSSPDLLWPTNHKMGPEAIMDVARADGNPLALTITSVYQDEPMSEFSVPFCR